MVLGQMNLRKCLGALIARELDNLAAGFQPVSVLSSLFDVTN